MRIQNLQRANIYLKSKLKELESGRARMPERACFETDTAQYSLVPVGPVQRDHERPYYQPQRQYPRHYSCVNQRLDIHPSRKRFQGYRSRSVYFTIDEDEKDSYTTRAKQMSLLSEERDLRPATFIREIEFKSRKLEEEKVRYHHRAETRAVTRDGFDELLQLHRV